MELSFPGAKVHGNESSIIPVSAIPHNHVTSDMI